MRTINFVFTRGLCRGHRPRLQCLQHVLDHELPKSLRLVELRPMGRALESKELFPGGRVERAEILFGNCARHDVIVPPFHSLPSCFHLAIGAR